MSFTKNEKKDLLFTGLIISLAFAILLSGSYRVVFNVNSTILLTFFIAFLTAGLGFLLHELAHKFTAQKYNLYAEFKAYYNGLWLALLFSLFGFILVAQGAVYIRGWNISKEKKRQDIFSRTIDQYLPIFNISNPYLYPKSKSIH